MSGVDLPLLLTHAHPALRQDSCRPLLHRGGNRQGHGLLNARRADPRLGARGTALPSVSPTELSLPSRPRAAGTQRRTPGL